MHEDVLPHLTIERKGKAPLCPLTPQEVGFDDKPLWNHVAILSIAMGGGNRCWTYNYCNKKVNFHILRLRLALH